jgi:plastocyanin
MTFFPPTVAIAARQFSRQNLGFTYNPYLPNGAFRRASGSTSVVRAAELAALTNPLGLTGLGSNPYLSTLGYGGGYGGGSGGGGYGGGSSGGGGYGGAGYQSPYLATSYQNPSQDSGTIQAAAPADPNSGIIQAAAPAVPNPDVNINITDDGYEPRSITIAAGTIVRWENVGHQMHTVTSDTGLWDSQEMDTGRSVRVFFAKPGTYTYRCTSHPDKLRGTVIVE